MEEIRNGKFKGKKPCPCPKRRQEKATKGDNQEEKAREKYKENKFAEKAKARISEKPHKAEVG